LAPSRLSRLDFYDSPSNSDEIGEEVIYSHESPKVDEFIRDFNWGLDRLLSSDHLSQEKKYYHLAVLLLIGIEIILYIFLFIKKP
jgi:hypothetical protein